MARWVDASLGLRTASLLATGVGLGAALHLARPHALSLQPPVLPLACSATPDAEAASIDEATATEVVSLCGQPGVLLADTRSASSFAAGHVASALHVPCAPGPLSPARQAAVAQADTVVVMADSTEAAKVAAAALRRYAPRARWKVLAGGFAAWETAGLACASGPCEECMAVSTPGNAP